MVWHFQSWEREEAREEAQGSKKRSRGLPSGIPRVECFKFPGFGAFFCPGGKRSLDQSVDRTQKNICVLSCMCPYFKAGKSLTQDLRGHQVQRVPNVCRHRHGHCLPSHHVG